MTLASQLFEATRIQDKLDTELFEKLWFILSGKTFEETYDLKNFMPFEDFTYDYYDSSVEIKDIEVFELTEEQQEKIWELGFFQCWIHQNGKELFYSKKRKK